LACGSWFAEPASEPLHPRVPPASAAMPPKTRLNTCSEGPRRATICNAAIFDTSHHQHRRKQLETSHESEQRNCQRFGGNYTAKCDADDHPKCGSADRVSGGTAATIMAIGTLRRRKDVSA
jgi:hypothetical protein